MFEALYVFVHFFRYMVGGDVEVFVFGDVFFPFLAVGMASDVYCGAIWPPDFG